MGPAKKIMSQPLKVNNLDFAQERTQVKFPGRSALFFMERALLGDHMGHLKKLAVRLI